MKTLGAFFSPDTAGQKQISLISGILPTADRAETDEMQSRQAAQPMHTSITASSRYRK
jgi:hypothetical protein